MGGLVGYFSRSWRGNTSESVQDLVGNNWTETSLTCTDFQSNDRSANDKSELQTLPPSNDVYTDDWPSNTPTANGKVDETIDEVDGDCVKNDVDGLFQDRLINFTPLESGDRFQEINNIVRSVLQIYTTISTRRDGIRKSLGEFREEFGPKLNSTLSQLFTIIRSEISSNVRVELVCAGLEPIKLKIDESPEIPVPENVKRAAIALNTALTLCQKYKGEKELKLADIQFKLDDLHLMPLTHEGQQLYESVSNIPSYLEELSTDIDRLHQQLYEARLLLRPK